MAAAARCSTVRRAVVALAAQIEIGVAPGVELGGAAQCLTGTDGAGALFGMVDEHDGNGMAALQFAQIGEQRCDLAAGVLIDAVQAYEGIENEQPRLQLGDGLVEAARSASRSRRRVGAVMTWMSRSASPTPAAAQMPSSRRRTMCEGVLGGIEQDAAGSAHGKAAQAGDAGGNGDREIQGEERFAALGLAADDADGLFGPQAGRRASAALGALGETPGRLDRKQGHRRRPDAAWSRGGGTAQVSRNSFSSICRASR